ncbi:Hsp70 family protein [Vibrio parahaemolyticus]|uniref:Hsp70 family protein n=1 Tax=Vibrio parahaemolyticus TaxID=670 RepID=UPI00226A43DC|nr:Hsp70 family protein [Vibrio parahaemolyticus]MCX8865011.1 Hsp70 family protein [Vibrio parahaemolyticus]MCX8870120.1 Hsp70 family protein [Vibrio parahaemolyticus]
MVQKIGIDFGTTNSLISVVTKEGMVKSFTDRNRPHPSVVSYDNGKVVCGTKAKKKLEDSGIGVFGNTIRGPKKFIGGDHIPVGGEIKHPKDVVADLMRFLVEHAEEDDASEIADLSTAVVTIPVAMDGRSRHALREALLDAGINIDCFVHEPLAALYGYYQDQEDPQNAMLRDEGKTVLVFDWGGGTLDLTLCQIRSGTIVQVMNRGNNKVGGDYLDDAILNFVEEQHALKFGWTEETKKPRHPGMKAKLLEQCEKAKITLSKRSKDIIFVPDYYSADSEEESEIEFELTKEILDRISSTIVSQGISEIETLLSAEQADMDHQTIALCLATGGMVNMPIIEQQLREIFGVAVLEVSPKGDRIISEGAAWIAKNDLGLTLAKPFELVEARNSLLSLIPEGTDLPKRGNTKSITQGLYCADPRDGKAVLTFKRPQMVGKSAASDRRTTYANLSVPVNPDFPPMKERIDVLLEIDENYIVTVSAKANDLKHSVSQQIFDLEFALQATKDTSVGTQGKKY